MQHGGGRRRHPGGVGAGPGVGDFLFEHGGHQIRHGPHALADLRAAAQAAAETDQHVVALVGLNPRRALHVALAQHRPGFHGRVHLVAGAVEEAGVDEGHPRAGGGDAGLEVDAGAPLLVHDAHLQGVARQLQEVFDTAEQLVGEGHFERAVHLRLDDVDAAAARVAAALEVMQGDQAGHHPVENAFGDLAAFAVENRRVAHQVTDVAHEQQRTAVQGQVAAVGAAVLTVRVEAAGDALAALVQLLAQVALHQAQPVAVDQHLVVGIDRGDRVFAIENGRQRRFHQQILDPGGIGLADRAARVDLDLHMQAIVLQQDGAGLRRLALVAEEFFRLAQAAVRAIGQSDLQLAGDHPVTDGVGMRTAGQRRGLVEEGPGEGDHLGPAHLVIAGALLRPALFADRVGAVERVIQRAPARIGGVQRVARIHHRHHQLRAGLAADLAVDLGGAGLHAGRWRQQVADGFEEGAVGRHIRHRPRVGAVPGVQFALQTIALGQQRTVVRRQLVDQGVEAGPEGLAGEPGARQHFFIDETLQVGGHLQALAVHAIGHLRFSNSVLPCPAATAAGVRLCSVLCVQARAATPALATWASCSALTPDTPTAPITWPSTISGTPPSREVSSGADRKALRPPLTMSS
ncbi:hypothetical protein D3C85_620950 [compost metagenome]